MRESKRKITVKVNADLAGQIKEVSKDENRVIQQTAGFLLQAGVLCWQETGRRLVPSRTSLSAAGKQWLNIVLTSEMESALDELAELYWLDRSQLIRELLGYAIEGYERTKVPGRHLSARDLAFALAESSMPIQ